MNEPTELQKQQLQMLTQFDWVFALAGTLFLTIGVCWIGYQTYWGQGTALIEGRVVQMKMSDGKGGLFPVVAYTVDGKVFEVQGISTKPPAYSVGDPAMVQLSAIERTTPPMRSSTRSSSAGSCQSFSPGSGRSSWRCSGAAGSAVASSRFPFSDLIARSIPALRLARWRSPTGRQ